MGENELSLMPPEAPTVGRIVHVFAAGSGDPLAAIVVRANGLLPDLAILDPTRLIEAFLSQEAVMQPVLARTVPHRVAGYERWAWDWPARV